MSGHRTPNLQLYNTLERKKVDFQPIDAERVRMYVCGPTVYDHAHIGNARPVIVFDVLYRLLRHLYGEDHVDYVRNITDVDDKIIARARRDFPDLALNEAIRHVTETTARQFHEDVAALGCLPPNQEPRATEHIAQMVALIQKLLDKGHAYVATGGEGREVLFDIRSMPDYGQLSGRRLEEQQAGARVAVEAHKKNAGDFVLWKESDASEPGWSADFRFKGRLVSVRGRPGWHIECSAMSEICLGETFDIHGGGLDLVFPHHENEIAQSRCAHGTTVMANVWMHNGYLQVEGRKMSKSEGNFVTIHDLLHTDKFGGERWPPQAVRWLMLATDYREPLDFSVDRLREAVARLRAFARVLYPLYAAQDDPEEYDGFDRFAVTGPSDDLIYSLSSDIRTTALDGHFERLLQQARGKFGGFFQERAVHQLHADLAFIGIDMTGWSEAQLKTSRSVVGGGGSIAPGQKAKGQADIDAKVQATTGGPQVKAEGQVISKDDYSASIQSAVDRRLAFIRDRNWAEADRIREELLTKGIQLMDSKDPGTGERITRWEVKR